MLHAKEKQKFFNYDLMAARSDPMDLESSSFDEEA